jgi:hypothetical protein
MDTGKAKPALLPSIAALVIREHDFDSGLWYTKTA